MLRSQSSLRARLFARSVMTSERTSLHCEGFGDPPNDIHSASSRRPSRHMHDFAAVLAWRLIRLYADFQSTFVRRFFRPGRPTGGMRYSRSVC